VHALSSLRERVAAAHSPADIMKNGMRILLRVTVIVESPWVEVC
jgi:hypothetical protein